MADLPQPVADVADLPQPVAELTQMQEGDEVVGQVLRYVRDGEVLRDPQVQRSVLAERDRFVVLDGLLFYVDPARKDRARLVVSTVLRQQRRMGRWAV